MLCDGSFFKFMFPNSLSILFIVPSTCNMDQRIQSNYYPLADCEKEGRKKEEFAVFVAETFYVIFVY